MARRIVWVVVLLLLAAGLWYALQPRPVAVDVARVARGHIRSFVEEEGMTRVTDRYVVAAPVAGRLLRLGLDEGDPVGKGDCIAEIDPLPLKSRVQEAEAQVRALRKRTEGVERKKPKPEELERARALEQVAREALEVAQRELEEAQADLQKAERDINRERRLVESGTSTPADLETAEAAQKAALARKRAREVTLEIRTLQITAAKLNTVILAARLEDFEWEKGDYAEQIAAIEAKLAALRDDLERARICAPVSGVVLNLFEQSERMVAAGTPLFEIGDLKGMEVEADFLSEDAAHMRVDMPAEIFGRAVGEKVVRGKLARIYPSAFRKISSLGVEQQRVKVVAAFDASEASLGDRFRVEVRVILAERRDVLLVPEGALFSHAGKWHVFRLEGGRAVLAPVETGLRDGRTREVSTGLAEGDEVVLHPGEGIEDGVRVERLAR